MAKETNSLWSRRNFLKGAAITGAAAGISLVGCSPSNSGKASNTPNASSKNSSTSTVDWLGTEPEIESSAIVEVVDTDVVVVGGGTGGLFTACSAGEEGVQVIVLEKFIEGGGIRDAIGGVNSKLQQADGTVIDKEAITFDMFRYAAGQCKMSLYHLWYEKSAETVNWWSDRLGEKGITLTHKIANKHEGAPNPYWETEHYPLWPKDDTSLNGTSVLTAYAESLGTVSFRYETPMVKLVKTDEKVTGVIAKNKKGEYLQINARKGVVVCTGGYARNEAMMNALQPHTQSIYGRNTSIMGTEGEGIKACLWAGAAMDETHTSMLFDRTALLPDQTGGYQAEGKMFWMASHPWLKVNLNGERFCNESTLYDYILHAASSEPDNIFCTLWDSDYITYAEQFDMFGCSRIFPTVNGVPPIMTIQAIQGMNAGLLESGYIQQANTIEELVEKLNLPVDALVKTVTRQNENYDNKTDPDFGKESYRLSPLRTAPFFGVRNTGSLLCTLDGIVINEKCQALRTDGSPIKGLYVVGNDSGCYYSMTYPNIATGHAAGRTATFGRTTGKTVAKL